jgi:3-isopropylmalate/(R)-2-methylmalate dehydratase small subunit
MIAWKYVIERQVDPDILVPQLFAQIDPDFALRVKPGDFIIAGRGFASGKVHTTAYVAMQALGLRILCESTFVRVIRATVNMGVPMMPSCAGIASLLKDGEEIEVDMSTGEVLRLQTAECLRYQPISEDMREVLLSGGRHGVLKRWLSDHPELANAPTENAK